MTRPLDPRREAFEEVNTSTFDPLRPSPRLTAEAGNHRKPPARVRGSGSPPSSRHHAGPKMVPANIEVEIIAVIEGKRGAWSAPDLAELLGCSGKHIYALAKSGRLPHLRIDGMIRFDPGATAAWLRERFVAAA